MYTLYYKAYSILHVALHVFFHFPIIMCIVTPMYSWVQIVLANLNSNTANN